jgi:nicotinate-nucleotide adenylyltransferase
MARLGLFGGTFDPPHLGHVRAARAAVASLGLERLVVTVAADPTHREAPTAPAALRLEMAHAAFDGEDRVEVSDLELRRGGPTYTIDTVLELRREVPDLDVVVVLGADAAAGLPTWHRADELASLVAVAVVPRPGGPFERPEGFFLMDVRMEPIDLSSTAVREALRRGDDPASLVPAGVVRALLTNRLYSP